MIKVIFTCLTFLATNALGSQTLFEWPLKQANNFSDNSYYYMSNHVDHDAGVGVLDYSGGSRTYNGHDGTDIVVWPFPWNKMDKGQVDVVAAADGVIVARADGNFDQSCAWTGGSANVVRIQHSDGSIASYVHLKKNSVTSKIIGQTVKTGEYLGKVGSSGNSTIPHLHFEVRTADGSLVDPFAGPDNNTTPSSWWKNQRPYHDSGLNQIVTSSINPESSSPDCPTVENTHEKCVFMSEERIVFSRFYRHSVLGQLTFCKLYQPDGTIWDSWTHTHSATAKRRYSWNSRILPANAQEGTWKFEADYLGKKHVRSFLVSDSNVTCNCDYRLDINSQNTYHSANSILSNSLIINNENISYKAGNFVELNPGFEAKNGAVFEAAIGNCDN